MSTEQEGARASSPGSGSRPASLNKSPLSPSASESTTAHPLLAQAANEPSQAASGGYAVYDKTRRRTGSSSINTSVVTPTSSVLSPSEGPLAPSPVASSTATTPPFAPSSTHSLPPLVSRPSSSQIPPATQGRQYARSVSEAKVELQRQALKAGLRDLGLTSESTGAALVTLLLPAERLEVEGSLPFSFLLDHLVLLDPPSAAAESASHAAERPFATLSGLRGVLIGGELVFTSATQLPHDAPQLDFADETVQRRVSAPVLVGMLRGATRLPAPPPFTHYPSSMLVSAITNLSIPQTRSTSPAAPPPPNRTTSRLAALFAKPAGQTPDTAGPATPSAETSDAGAHSRLPASVEVPVLAVGKTIKRTEIAGTMCSALLAHLRAQAQEVEGFAGEADGAVTVEAFARQFVPTSALAPPPAGSTELPPPSLLECDPAILSEAYQDAMADVRLDLSRNLGSPPAAGTSPADPGLEDFTQLEERIDASLEKLEAIVTSTMYDRLFAPPTSRDLQEDENLASRIAALNVLGLDLEHLGVDLAGEQELEDDWRAQKSGPRDSLEMLAHRVGRELNHLEDPEELTPTAKLAILVECHKIIVDGLSDLPAIRLQKEVAAEDKSAGPAMVEMDDASSKASSQPPSRTLSPSRQSGTSEEKEAEGDDLLRTPRPPSQEERAVPEIKLPESARDLSDSMSEATGSSMVPAEPSPPLSVFEKSRGRDRPSASATTSSSSADLILPLLIYSVVRANPPHLVSHLRYIHRFRCESLLHGQASYCATNFDAVIEWAQHVDLSTLGLSSASVLSSPTSEFDRKLTAPVPARPRAYTTPSTLLRERVSLTADQLVDSAGTALTGVVDSSYRLLFGAGGLASSAPKSLDDVKNVLDGARGRAREKLPFRRSTSARDFPALITGRRRATSTASGQVAPIPESGPAEGDGSPARPGPPPLPPRPRSPTKDGGDDSDARSVRSVSSFLGFRESTFGRAISASNVNPAAEKQEASSPEASPAASSLGGRLLGRIADGASSSARRATLLNPLVGWSGSSAAANLEPIPASPAVGSDGGKPYAPLQRFLDVGSAGELKLGEVEILLAEYRKAVQALQAGSAPRAVERADEATQASADKAPTAGDADAALELEE
ncbi:hypothetical protein JCM8202v2_004054 [Rhodotorula sphaerocarpa]